MSADPTIRRATAIPADLRQQVATSDLRGARPTYTETQLEDAYQLRLTAEEKKARKQDLLQQRKVGKEAKAKSTRAFGLVTRFVPCIRVFTNYKPKEYFVFDLLSGVSVGLFAIPQAIAFALLAGLKPQNGFYSAFFAMAIYFIFGTSNHLNMTHQGAVSLIVGDAVKEGVKQAYDGRICPELNELTTLGTTWSPNDSTTVGMAFDIANSTTDPTDCLPDYDARVRVSISVCMVAGIVQLLMGIFQLGFLTIYLSDPLNSAFTCGAALHILSSQLSNILGAKFADIQGFAKFFLNFGEGFRKIFNNEVNPPTIFVFFGFFALLLAIKLVNERCTKYVKIPIPIDIIVLLSSLLLSYFFKWNETLKIEDVGEIPAGFEPPQLPASEHFTSGMGIVINGIVLGIISYSLSVSVAKTFGLRHGYEIDANQESIAYGAVNFGMCWFSTFASASSIACTSLHESMRGKTLFYSVYSVIIMLIGILVLAPLFQPVPKCVLSAIILVNLKNMMMQVDQLPGLWRTNKYDFAIWLVTLAAILGLDLPTGLLSGVVFSLATLIFRSQAPKAYLLGRVPKTDIYKNIKKNKSAEEIPGVKIFKFDGSLYFASAENFRTRLYRQVAMNPKKILAKAQQHAKLEGRHETDLRTDVVEAKEIKRVLDEVTHEGYHPDESARRRAQAASSSALADRSDADRRRYDDDDDDDDDSEEPTVNVFCIILDLAACAFTDAVGIRLLKQIVEDFNKIGVEIYLSGCTSLVRSQMAKGDFFKKRDEQGIFVTVHDAVIYALSVFYKELLEDEREDAGDTEVEEEINDPTLHRKVSVNSSSSGEQQQPRDLRRHTRKVSRMRHPDEMARQYRKASERMRESERLRQMSAQEGDVEAAEATATATATATTRRRSDSPKPLEVFEYAEDGESEAERKRREFDENIDEKLKTLPEDAEGSDNPAFVVDVDTAL